MSDRVTKPTGIVVFYAHKQLYRASALELSPSDIKPLKMALAYVYNLQEEDIKTVLTIRACCVCHREIDITGKVVPDTDTRLADYGQLTHTYCWECLAREVKQWRTGQSQEVPC